MRKKGFFEIMIKLTRLNGTVFYVNSEMIEFIESTPDTVITLSDDKKLVVDESVDEVIEKIVKFKHRVSIYSAKESVYREEV